MSAVAIGARIAEIDAMLQALGGPPPAAPAPAAGASTFAQALAGAQQPSPAATSAGATPFGAEIDAAAARHGIDPALLRGLIRQESGFDPSARSPAGALGLTQLMPGTARELGVTDATDPAQAIDGGARYLRRQLDRFGGREELALAAYNAGPGAVSRFGGIPPYAETQNYVKRVMQFATEYRSAAPVLPAPTAAIPVATAPVPAPTPTYKIT